MIRLNGRAVETFPEENIPDGRLGRKPIATGRVLEAALSDLVPR
jgi:hypothetical protein